MSLERPDNLDDRSDEELALALQRGDEGAFDVLVRRHQGMVYAVAYRMTGRREEALDVAQEAFLKAYRKIDAWKPSGYFGAWLVRLTSNQAIDHLRKISARQRREIAVESMDVTEKDMARDLNARADAGVRGREIEERVQDALSVLSPAQRLVFVLRHYEGRPLAEIAPVVGCSVGSVKVHLFRAVRKLREELNDFME